jgi:hypothetical protein
VLRRFDRWHIGWNGPRRILPGVVFTIVADPEGQCAFIRADGGLAPPLSQDDRWRQVIDQALNAACNPG